MTAYVGSYTSQDGGAEGIALADLDAGTVRTVAEVPDPSLNTQNKLSKLLLTTHTRYHSPNSGDTVT